MSGNRVADELGIEFLRSLAWRKRRWIWFTYGSVSAAVLIDYALLQSALMSTLLRLPPIPSDGVDIWDVLPALVLVAFELGFWRVVNGSEDSSAGRLGRRALLALIFGMLSGVLTLLLCSCFLTGSWRAVMSDSLNATGANSRGLQTAVVGGAVWGVGRTGLIVRRSVLADAGS